MSRDGNENTDLILDLDDLLMTTGPPTATRDHNENTNQMEYIFVRLCLVVKPLCIDVCGWK